MSQPRGFGLNGKSIYQNVCKPMDVNLNFIVDSTNGNGFGTRSLKSNGYVEAVFMHTTQTPGKAPGGNLNPNPVAGYALVIFKNNFNKYLGGYSGQVTPVSSPGTTSLTAHNAYVITSLGSTTAAQWLAAGVPAGFVAAVGLSFVAIATGAIGGSGTVGLPGEQVAPIVSVVGDPNVQISNAAVMPNSGAQVLLQFSGPTAAGNTALIATAPADNTVVGMQFNFDGSSVTIDGI